MSNLDRHYIRTLEFRLKQITEQAQEDTKLLDWLESRKGRWKGWEVTSDDGIVIDTSNREIYEPFAYTLREAIRKARECAK